MQHYSNLSETVWILGNNYSGIEHYIHGNDTSDEHTPLRHVIVGLILSILALCACVGNILVILSVFTNRRLRTVTNCFVVSLAVADLCVSILVMPLGIIVEVTGRWLFGSVLCEIWVSCDVMLCTASILNLCCISLDRYNEVTSFYQLLL